MDEVRVAILGPFRVTDGVRGRSAQLLRKPQDLLAMMLLAPERRILRAPAVEALRNKSS